MRLKISLLIFSAQPSYSPLPTLSTPYYPSRSFCILDEVILHSLYIFVEVDDEYYKKDKSLKI